MHVPSRPDKRWRGPQALCGLLGLQGLLFSWWRAAGVRMQIKGTQSCTWLPTVSYTKHGAEVREEGALRKGLSGRALGAHCTHHGVLTPQSQAVVLHLAPGILHAFFRKARQLIAVPRPVAVAASRDQVRTSARRRPLCSGQHEAHSSRLRAACR